MAVLPRWLCHLLEEEPNAAYCLFLHDDGIWTHLLYLGMPSRIRCSLIIRSAWPLALSGDDSGLVTSKAARKSGSRCRIAVVCTQSSATRNTISNKFARQLLGTDAYNLARLSTTGATIGQVAAILTWPETALLWTTYFILDDLADVDIKLGQQSWVYLATLGKRLPTPWVNAAARIQVAVQPPRKTVKSHAASKSQGQNGDGSGHYGIATPVEAKRHVTRSSPSSVVSACTDGTSFDATFCGIDNDETPAERGSDDTLSSLSDPDKPCTSTTKPDDPEVGEEHWVWDSKKERYHLSGRSENDFGYWYPRRFA